MGLLTNQLLRFGALPALLAAFASGSTSIRLPLEIAGDAGAVASVAVELPEGTVPVALWMRVHGVSFPAMASVRVNDGDWRPLTNETVAVSQPARSYGGIGGAFASFEITLPLNSRANHPGTNTIQFRFNGTNGVASGFRVLVFNFLDSAGKPLLAPETFAQEDPSLWEAPIPGDEAARAGMKLWSSAPLKANGLEGAAPIRAHCSDCHTRDGRDLKYFNFSNASIVARARFHGLTDQEGKQIASYIRGLALPNPGRPWNPPYQPGPGIDARPVAEWAAGAGLEMVLRRDEDTLPYLFGGQPMEQAFRPDARIRLREIPIAMQLPDWNHWLPRVHPLDFRGELFERSGFGKWRYNGPASFDQWMESRARFVSALGRKWTPELAEGVYSAQLWQLVKTWEAMQENQLETARRWSNAIPAATAPSAAGIPGGRNGMGGSTLLNEYFSSAWYELQSILGEPDQHRSAPLYRLSGFLSLREASGIREPARLLTQAIQSFERADPSHGPGHYDDGWTPERNIDPRLLVDPQWGDIFRDLPPETRRAIAEALLTAWLDKNEQYPLVSYFQLGRTAQSYPPKDKALRSVTGGRAWDTVAAFRELGVRPALLRRLEAWGAAWTELAARFQY
jgi:hypothetical protein